MSDTQKKLEVKVDALPDFLIELSHQMNTDPVRCTAHPFWQVRCKRHIVTEQGYNEKGFVICGDDGEIFRSWDNDSSDIYNFLKNNYPEWLDEWLEDNDFQGINDENNEEGFFCDNFEEEGGDLPESLSRVFVQETEEVVSTHLTQSAAEAFIRRKQHDYPALYTYVESAYWSPQLRELQDWIKSLT